MEKNTKIFLHCSNAKFCFSFKFLDFIIITYIYFNYESIINILKYKIMYKVCVNIYKLKLLT